MTLLLFFLRRLIQLLPVMIGITIVAFILLRILPGDPASLMIGARGSEADVEALRQQLGLNAPLWQQYLTFLGDVLNGSFGQSVVQRRPVSLVVAERLWPTIALVAYATVLAIIITLPLATISAIKRNSLIDFSIQAVFVAVMSMPAFWLGVLLILLLGIKLPLFPVAGYGTGFLDRLWHLFLPALVIALGTSALTIRSLRSSLIAVRSAEFVDTARSKGLNEGEVLRRHIMRNSLISTVSVLSVHTSWVIGGTVVIEAVFALPGLGNLLVTSVFARDYPVVQGLTIVFALLVMAISILTDLAYAAIDPRIRLQ
ncbi:ABC transporter permease [Rhodoligotrophos ferricapiens]|uniref:ABC transporter permease n=1 Tax=Rhodoligotrophos ferricapiens TaxID=3069264 RepID=UPI00315D8CDE